MSDDPWGDSGGAVGREIVPPYVGPEEDNWHAESDKLGFWLIMSIPIGFIVATVLVVGIFMLAGPQ